MDYLNSFLFIFIINSCLAQTVAFSEFNFDDYEPIWFSYVEDESVIGKEAGLDGYNHVTISGQSGMKLIEKDGYIYTVNNTFLDGDYAGGIIIKRTLDTGEIIWKTTFDTRDYDRHEFASLNYIKGDELCIVGMKYAINNESPFSIFPLSRDVVWFQRKYNIGSGELTSENYVSDESYKFSSTNVNYFNIAIGQDLRLGQVVSENVNSDYIYYNTDDSLNLSPQDAFSIIHEDTSDIYFFNGALGFDTGFVTAESSFLFGGETYDNNIYVWNTDNTLKSRISKDKINLFFQEESRVMDLMYADDEILIVRFTYTLDDDFVSEYVKLDHQGNLLKKYSIDQTGNVYYDHKNDCFLEFSLEKTDGIYTHTITRVVDSMRYELPIKCMDKEISFNIIRHKVLDNNHLLLEGIQSKDTIIDFEPMKIVQATFHMLIDGADLGLVTDLDDVEDVASVMIFPNPVQNRMMIDVDGLKEYQVHIYDHFGRLVKTIDHKADDEVEVSELRPGVYHLLIRDVHEHKIFRKIIKI